MYFRSRKINFNEILTEDITTCVLPLFILELAYRIEGKVAKATLRNERKLELFPLLYI